MPELQQPQENMTWLDRFMLFRHDPRFVFTAMLIAAVLSLIASFVLTMEAFHLAENPEANFACDINAVLSCGEVARSWQASVFGFPNALLGLVSEPIIIAVSIAGIAGVTFPRGYMVTAQVFYSLGLVFAYWLLYQSYMYIGALCPWCLLISVVTTIVFMEMTTYNILNRNIIFFNNKWHDRLTALVLKGADIVVILLIFTAMGMAILLKYGTMILA